MRSNLLLGLTSLVLQLAVVACTRVPAESNAPATPPPAPAAAPSPAAPAAAPAPPAGTEPAPTAPAAVPLAGVSSTALGTGHVTLTGSYKADADAEATCALTEGSLEVTLRAHEAPRVLLRLHGLSAKSASGTYKGQVSVIAPDMGEAGFRQSVGTASAKITVEAPASPKEPARVSGSFSTRYAGEGGKGTVAGRFERCGFKESSDLP